MGSGFLLRVAGLSRRDRQIRGGGGLRVDPLLLRFERGQFWLLGHLIKTTAGGFPSEVFWARLTGGR